VTLHSFAGIGLGKEPAEELVKKIRKNQKARHRWMRTKILVIDEVSMVDGELFDKLEQVARTLRNNGRPFGGIQLVITGDFFQLPPVPESGRLARFAFDAGTWNTSIEHTIGLHHVFRQKDPVFANMLNEMREGRLSQKSISAFRSLDRKLDNFDDLEATELFPTRQEVDRANQVRMQNLHGVTQTFEARDGGTVTDKTYRDKMLANCMAPEYIHLKKGAQVMLIKNLDDTLVNGSLGKVIGFMSEQTFDKYTEDEEGVMAAQAVTEGGEPGIAGNIAPSDIKSKSKSDLLGTNTSQIYPVVRFVLADNTTRDLLCQRETWKIELPNGEVQASRAQIPLILAWALSIHKAQGQTLERVKVDLGKVFEKGQAYVALSRATAMAGLQVLRFDPKKVMAHERVRVFYSSLTRAEQAGGGVTKAKPEKKKKGKLGFSAIEYEKRVAGNSDDDEDARAALRDH
jgi:ATP-dependent DNA helicase PIF1